MPDAPDTALVVVNLGTPEAPTATAVRRYLGEFLGDPRVVSLPRLLWLPLLHGIILPLRGPRAAAKYAQVWMPEGSPLAVYTRRLSTAIQAQLPEWRVVPAMRYGQPALSRTLATLRAEGVRRVVILPLYPQYSTTTTASVADLVAREAGGLQTVFIDDYAEDAAWAGAVGASLRAHWQRHGRAQHLLFSYHGLPQRVADAGDPYPQQCEASTRAILEALGPDAAPAAGAWSLSYQSRFGRERWLEPATEARLDALADAGVRSVDVVCPGFAVDCLETLEEIAIGLAERFAERGGTLRYVPCLNDDTAHAQALAALARRHAGNA